MFVDVWLVPLGFVAGILGSMIGLGGGIIIVPVLTFLGFPPSLASSNSLFGTFGNATASTLSYWQQKRIQYSLGLKLGLLAIPGTILGAYVSSDVTPSIFKILFGLVLLSSSVYIFMKRKIEGKESSFSHAAMFLSIFASFFAGIISSFFGIGGGIIFVPLMVAIMGMGMKKAAPTSQFILLFVSLSGLITHSVLGHPDFYQSLLLFIGSFVGALVGSKLSLEIKEKNLQILVSIVMSITAIKLFFDALGESF